MFAEQRDPAVCASSDNKESKGEMTKAPIRCCETCGGGYTARRRLNRPTRRFWGLYVHVCKLETLRESYRQAKLNNGAPGIDGSDVCSHRGLRGWKHGSNSSGLNYLSTATVPRGYDRVAIPKPGGTGVRVLSIPTIRDRVVQGALKLILEPIFEADFQSGSYGYRPKRSAHAAVERVAQAIVHHKTPVR